MHEEVCIMKNRIDRLDIAIKMLVDRINRPTYGPMLEEKEDES